jgi:hypothetical protein
VVWVVPPALHFTITWRHFVANRVRHAPFFLTLAALKHTQEPAMFKPLLLSALLTLSLHAHAVSDAQFQPAFALFTQATEGQSSAIAPAADAFGRLLATEPAHPVLLAYSGAATSMQATTTWLPWKKLSHAEDGLARLDKALALLTPANSASLTHGVPAALSVKLVAANTFLAVPSFMNRHDRGERLLKEVQADPLLPTTPAEFRAAVNKAAHALQPMAVK